MDYSYFFYHFLFRGRNVYDKVGRNSRTFWHSVTGCIINNKLILSNRYHELVELTAILFYSRSTYDSVRFNAGPGPNYSSLGRCRFWLVIYASFFSNTCTKMQMENFICHKTNLCSSFCVNVFVGFLCVGVFGGGSVHLDIKTCIWK